MREGGDGAKVKGWVGGKLSCNQEGRRMQHGQKEDRKGIGTRIRVGNRERNCADNGLAALIYYLLRKRRLTHLRPRCA